MSKKQEFELEDSEFLLYLDSPATLKKIVKDIEDAKRSVDIICSSKQLQRVALKFFGYSRQALRKDVKVRIITEVTEENIPKKYLLEKFKQEGATFKFILTTPKVMFVLLDGKEVFISTSPDGSPNSSIFYSSNPVLIMLSQSYFDKRWNLSSTTPIEEITFMLKQ